jgi:hypothetical protein
LFVHVVTCRARGVTKGVHYIAFLAGAHQNNNFDLEKLFSNFLNLFEHAQTSSHGWLEVFLAAQILFRVGERMIFELHNHTL